MKPKNFFINDSIRLSVNNQEKLKSGVKEVFELINRPVKKFEKSLIIVGEVSLYGFSNF